MPRRTRTRWVVITTALDNGQHEVFGPWLSYDKTKEVADQVAKTSTRYHGDEGIFDIEVNLARLQPWPGIRAFKRDA